MRPIEEVDSEALANFQCSRGRWFQDEAESFIRTELFQRWEAGETQGLVFGMDAELLAVAAYRRGTLIIAEDPGELEAAELVVLATSESLTAATIADDGRLSDYVMRTLIGEAVRFYRADFAYGLVAVENQRSLTMCERNGLVSQTRVNARYARVLGRFNCRAARET